MNIIIKPYEKDCCYCRPDTTWEKESRDLYISDGVEKVLWAPVVFAKVCKAGKCVSPKFISRYYDAVGFGALIYSDEENIAFSSCMDHSSILPVPAIAPVAFAEDDGVFTVYYAEKTVAISADENMQRTLEEAICKASERISLRIGDVVAVELSELQILAQRSEGETRFKAEYKENDLFDLKVIF